MKLTASRSLNAPLPPPLTLSPLTPEVEKNVFLSYSGTFETQIKRWGKELGLDTPKTSSCILLDEHGDFVHFGYKAKTTYTNMTGEEAEKHHFFEHFKTALDCDLAGIKMNDLRNQKIKAANNKSLKALKVFTEVLGYLKDDAMETIKAQAKEGEFTASDFTWVLTVPAFWGHPAKRFMTDSATQAGLVTKGTKGKLMVVLESEAALTWCLKLQSDDQVTGEHANSMQKSNPGPSCCKATALPTAPLCSPTITLDCQNKSDTYTTK
uniref:Uncharacterized protein n=1 Tax=Xiphophorus couchianus TaxID=32473 RepID=A0A3B5LL85_9TELE